MKKFKRHSRERGWVNMFSLLVTISFLGWLAMHFSSMREQAKIASLGKPFYNHIKLVKEQIEAYQADKVFDGYNINNFDAFPNSFSQLQPFYLPACSSSDNNAGRCSKPEQTPWNKTMTYTRLPPPVGLLGYRVEISIPLPADDDITGVERQVHIAELSQITNMVLDDSANTLTMTVHRINQGLREELLVSRDGNSTLLGDWDVGGQHAITNVKDLTVRNSDGSQRSLVAGNLWFVAKHNQRINKHKCPVGYTPGIEIAFRSAFNEAAPTTPINEVGAIRTYFTTHPSYWTVKLDYWAKVGGINTQLHSGEVLVGLLCR